MARMYPNQISEETTSHAERRLYNELRVQLPGDWIVSHGARWLIRDTWGGAQDGEIDFCIVSPEHGVLVLEVKGGRIRVDGETGRWFSNETPIQDPFAQAERGMRSLMAKMSDMPPWRSSPRPFVARAVAFPDVQVDGPLRPDAPEEIVLDDRKAHYLPEWCASVFAFFGSHRPLSPSDLQAITELLAPRRELPCPISTAIVQGEVQMAELTEGQYRLLDFLRYQRRVAVCGCAGSGKTLLAVEQARRLGTQGYRVLLTCFNKYLAEHFSAAAGLPKGVTIATFHGLCQQMGEAAHLDLGRPADMPDGEWYDKRMPEILLEAAGRLGGQYDAILVDEGQDFANDFWDPLKMLLVDPERGILYVFHDDNQNLYSTGLQLPDDLLVYQLSDNLRNTKEIHGTFCPFYSSRSAIIPRALGPDGRPPEIHVCGTADDALQTLRRVLHHLTHDESVRPQDIVVLSPHRRSGVVQKLPRLGNLQLVDTAEAGPGQVECTTIWAYKGLEKPVVILTDLTPPWHQKPASLFYVGASRAKIHLVVIAQQGCIDDIVASLPGRDSE